MGTPVKSLMTLMASGEPPQKKASLIFICPRPGTSTSVSRGNRELAHGVGRRVEAHEQDAVGARRFVAAPVGAEHQERRGRAQNAAVGVGERRAGAFADAVVALGDRLVEGRVAQEAPDAQGDEQRERDGQEVPPVEPPAPAGRRHGLEVAALATGGGAAVGSVDARRLVGRTGRAGGAGRAGRPGGAGRARRTRGGVAAGAAAVAGVAAPRATVARTVAVAAGVLFTGARGGGSRGTSVRARRRRPAR